MMDCFKPLNARCDWCGAWYLMLSYFHLKCSSCSLPKEGK